MNELIIFSIDNEKARTTPMNLHVFRFLHAFRFLSLNIHTPVYRRASAEQLLMYREFREQGI